MGHKLAIAILFVSVSSASGQAPLEFEAKYGKPVVAYQVSESIWMTPEYTTDGQVCMMRLHPRRFSPNTNFVSPRLPFQELTRVLNELVPIKTRGAKEEPFDMGATGGRMEWMSYAYENVRIRFVSPFDLAPDSWKTRKEYVFSIKPGPDTAQPKPKNSAPSDNDFSSSEALSTEIVTITWNGRQCESSE